MIIRIMAAALAVSGCLLGPAQAQWLGFGPESNVPLTREDLDLIKTTLQREIHGKRPDTVATWYNQASGNSGTITLLRKLKRYGMQCEQIAYEMRSRGPRQLSDRYVFVSCRLPDGTWKLAS